MKRYTCLFFGFFALGASHTLAADAPALPALAAPSLAVSLFRMFGSLAFVVALFFAGAWFFRNLHRFRGRTAPRQKLQVLEAKSLGVRQSIYVVGFEQQRMLIGATPQGLTLLTHLPDGAPAAESDRIVSVSFGEALLQALGRK